MAKYIYTELITTYKPVLDNGVSVLKPVGERIMAKNPTTTKQALRIISMYSGNIAPAGLCFDDKNRLESCRIAFGLEKVDGKTFEKSIEIKIDR